MTAEQPMANKSSLLSSGILHNYQLEAVEFILAQKRCALWLECGAGKSLAVIAALEQLESSKPTLIVAPKRCRDLVWPNELDKWLPEAKYQVIAGTPAKRLEQLAHVLQGGADIAIINYDVAPWLVAELPAIGRCFKAIVFDESSKLKAHNTNRFKALKKMVFDVEYLIQLTGTPAPNGLLQVWAPMYLLDKGEALGKYYTHYRDRFFTGDYMGYNWAIKDPKAVYDKIKHLTYTMTVEAYKDMQHHIKVPVQTKTKFYKEMQDTGITKDVVAESGASLQNKLRQLSSGFIYDEEKTAIPVHTHKIDALKDLVDELNGQPLLILYEFKHDLERLQKAFPKGQLFTDAIEPAWNRGEVPIMFLSPQSGGYGNNLQKGGHHIVWFCPPYDLELHIQANARLARQGQEADKVLVYYLCGVDTIDELVYDVLQNKNATQQDLLKTLEGHSKAAALMRRSNA